MKLTNKGLKYDEHNKFTFETKDNATVRNLIDDLHEECREQFEVYLEDTEKRILQRNAIVVVNVMNMVAKRALEEMHI
ncbi:MAG: hypothetical protein ACFFE3_07630 [Candidatus Thorarchaeota archaeon]